MPTVWSVNPKLAAAIEARRKELGLSVQDIATQAGVTRQGLRPLLKGEERDYQDRLKFPVCRVLGWTNDSIDRILRGGEPVINGGGVVTLLPLPGERSPIPDIVATLVRQMDELTQLVEALDADVRQAMLEWRQGGPVSEPGSP
jgi:transcriptional regulator with XRE-family HTH domain